MTHDIHLTNILTNVKAPTHWLCLKDWMFENNLERTRLPSHRFETQDTPPNLNHEVTRASQGHKISHTSRKYLSIYLSICPSIYPSFFQRAARPTEQLNQPSELETRPRSHGWEGSNTKRIAAPGSEECLSVSVHPSCGRGGAIHFHDEWSLWGHKPSELAVRPGPRPVLHGANSAPRPTPSCESGRGESEGNSPNDTRNWGQMT